MFAQPTLIETEVFTSIPDRFRKTGVPPDRAAASHHYSASGCNLEGPSFDREGNLFVVDNFFGRVFRISSKGDVDLIIEYDGEPNGLCIHKDGRIFVADAKNGILILDPIKQSVTPVVSRYLRETFRGVNDLTFSSQGDLYFTDQGATDLYSPVGTVYRLAANGQLHRFAVNAPSPNGLVLSKDERTLYLAVTRANAIWRLPFSPTGAVSRMGLYIQMSGGVGPDGMALDETGGLAVAHPGLGVIWIFDAAGEPRFRIQSCGGESTTNIAYGGPDMKSLFITDASKGAILVARVPTAGHKLYAHM